MLLVLLVLLMLLVLLVLLDVRLSMHGLRRGAIFVMLHGHTALRMHGTAHRRTGAALTVIAQAGAGMGKVTRALRGQDLRVAAVLVHVHGRHAGRVLLMLELHPGGRKMVTIHDRALFGRRLCANPAVTPVEADPR